MSKRIYINNPKIAYSVMAFMISLFGGVLFFQTLHSIQSSTGSKRTESIIALLTIGLITTAAVYRLITLYILPNYAWQKYAAAHNGKYSSTPDLQVQPYGMARDMLEAKDQNTGKSYVLLRTVQTHTRYGNLDIGHMVSSKYIVLAEPDREFSSDSKNGDHLSVITAKIYRWRVPTYEELSNTLTQTH